MSGPRRAVHFTDVPVHLDGKPKARITIEQGGSGDGLVTVRPHHGREYTLPLSTVAEMVAWKVAKAEAS